MPNQRVWTILERLGYVAVALAATRLAWVLYLFYAAGAAQRHHLESAWFVLVAAAVLLSLVRTPAPESRSPPATPRFTAWGLLAAGVIGSCLVYRDTLTLGLLSDDYVLLEFPVFSWGNWEFFRPVPLAVWTVIHPVFGSVGLHALNVGLHGLNTWLCLRLITRVSSSIAGPASLAAAAIFLTHPGVVEAIAWNAGIFDVALVTAALVFLTALMDERPRARLASIFAIVVGLLCKETAVALPLLGVLLAFRRKVDYIALAISIGICLAYVAVRMSIQEAPAIAAPMGYFIKEMVVRPFATLGGPWTTSEVNAQPFVLGLGPHVVFASIVIVYAVNGLASAWPALSALWVLAAAAPLLSYLYVGPDLEGGRYVYLPLVGWSLLLAELAGRLRSAALRHAVLAVFCGLAVMNVIGVERHLRPWREAAAIRDAVLSSAKAAMEDGQCAAPAFVNVPDHVSGAYVFRNGFREAVQRHVGRAVSTAAPPDCTFRWTGTAFTR